MRIYCLVRIHDGYKLRQFFYDKAAAEKHVEYMYMVTGVEYTVMNYVGSVPKEELRLCI